MFFFLSFFLIIAIIPRLQLFFLITRYQRFEFVKNLMDDGEILNLKIGIPYEYAVAITHGYEFN